MVIQQILIFIRTHSSNTLKRKKVDENKQTNKENEVNDLSSTVDPYEDKAGPSTAKTNESQSN